ncbi:hypothetical protein [Ectopseudomonas oleovorans]|nr:MULTISPECIES: hypothetical protein [Pseudomonas]MDG9978420.1 hypothetical protein [Pseudomonas oleovorans]MDH1340114.1 hypothetical protein [Pseudomonas oleovorans]MDH1494840.1 hypothetical protein [Pseudomonas oleovorans]WGG21976.1 hypothetical protein N5O83_04590 [Pseudomonas oleovorans]
MLALSTGLPTLGRLIVEHVPAQMPAVKISLIWHRQQHHDPAHAWLREQLRGLLA